jgi:hypothetical protein
MTRIVRSKALILFSEIASRCSAIWFHLKILASPLPIAYTVSTLLSRIAATAIMRLVITRLNLKVYEDEETSEANIVEIQELGASDREGYVQRS